jgi:hypothetical protein
MTQQQAAAVALGVVHRAQKSEHSIKRIVPRWPVPHLPHARLAQPCLVEHGQQMLLGHATILSRLVTLGWEVGLDAGLQVVTSIRANFCRLGGPPRVFGLAPRLGFPRIPVTTNYLAH